MVTLEKPDIIVGTPARILAHLKDKVRYYPPSLSPPPSPLLPAFAHAQYTHCCMQTLRLKKSLEMLVIDEADLLFSFGYEEDLKNLLRCEEAGVEKYYHFHFPFSYSYLPSIYQAFLMSATLTEVSMMHA